MDDLPVAAGSAALMRASGIENLHADFSDSDADGYGIPFNVVNSSTPRRNVEFEYDDESDRGPYPIPSSPRQEDASDAHILLLERDECRLYELYAASRDSGGSWSAGSGAVFNLRSNSMRPDGWTSADAAGLPILPGLARYDEVAAGQIDHALRITLPTSQQAYLWPARHYASSNVLPWSAPMGLRFRLKSTFDISSFPEQAQVILRAAREYGFIVADNGSAGYVSGAPDRGWSDDDLHALHDVPGSALEVVDTSSMMPVDQTRIWNIRIDRPRPGSVRARFLNTRRSTCRLQALRDSSIVARTAATSCGQGVVTRELRAIAGARYQVAYQVGRRWSVTPPVR